MFDINQQIAVDVEHRDGIRRAVVNWPTDEQWIRFHERLKLITKPSGNGIGTVDEIEGTEAAEEELYTAIMVSEEPALDPAERSEVLDRLQWQRLKGVERHGDEIRIEIAVPGALTVHRLAVPTAAEKKAYRNAIPAQVDLGRGKVLTPLTIAPQVKLYDVLTRGVEGYANNAVPPIHKSTAVRALLAKIEQAAEDRDFF